MIRLFSEFLGSLLLVATIIGSAIMAANLTSDQGVQLLINAIATVCTLFIIIQLLAPISGGHFNPVVTWVAFLEKRISFGDVLPFIFSQLFGAFTGAVLANLMFDKSAIEISQSERIGANLFLGEVIATSGLIMVVFASWITLTLTVRAAVISLWIGSAYFFTSSTSFANPAITFGRIWSDSFAGIAPNSLPLFLLAQIIGGMTGYLIVGALRRRFTVGQR